MRDPSISKIFGEIIRKLFEVERNLSTLRDSACFDIKDFDPFNNNYITAVDFKLFLKNKSIDTDIQDIYLLINQWDWDLDGKLSLSELRNFFFCNNNEKNTNNELVEMIFIELLHLKESEEDKFRLCKCENFQILDLFDYFERSSEFLHVNCLEKYLKVHDIEYDPYFLPRVFSRIAKKHTEIISYYEFADFFLCNQAYFLLGSCYPNKITSSLELNYSINKNHFKSTGERSEIFSRNSSNLAESEKKKTNFRKNEKNSKIRKKEIEKIKRNLALKTDFNIISIFQFFAGNDDWIGPEKFVNKVKKLGIDKKNQEILNFFEKFDADKIGRIRFNEFLKIFNPKDEKYQFLMQNHSKFKQKLSKETVKIIKIMLDILISAPED